MNETMLELLSNREWNEFARFSPGNLTLVGYRRIFWDLPRVAVLANLNYFNNVYYNPHTRWFYVSGDLSKAFWAWMIRDFQAKESALAATYPTWSFPTLTWNFDRKDIQRFVQEVETVQASAADHPSWSFPTLDWNRENIQRLLREVETEQQERDRLQITSDGDRAVLHGYILGEWPHIFAGDCERLVRWVYDLSTETVPFVQLYCRGAWSDATEGERQDVEESVQQHELERTWQEYDCDLAFALPDWAIHTTETL